MSQTEQSYLSHTSPPNFNSSSITMIEKPSSNQGLAKLQSRHIGKVNQQVWLKTGLNPDHLYHLQSSKNCLFFPLNFPSKMVSHPQILQHPAPHSAFFSYSTWKDFEAYRLAWGTISIAAKRKAKHFVTPALLCLQASKERKCPFPNYC